MSGFAAAVCEVAALSPPAFAQQGDERDIQITINVFKPIKLPVTADRIGQLKLPEGFSGQPLAQGLGSSRITTGSDIERIQSKKVRPSEVHFSSSIVPS